MKEKIIKSPGENGEYILSEDTVAEDTIADGSGNYVKMKI